MDPAAREERRQEGASNKGRQEAIYAGPHGGGAPNMSIWQRVVDMIILLQAVRDDVTKFCRDLSTVDLAMVVPDDVSDIASAA